MAWAACLAAALLASGSAEAQTMFDAADGAEDGLTRVALTYLAKVVHVSGAVLGLCGLVWVMRRPFRRFTDSQQDELDHIGGMVKRGEPISAPQSQFAMACAVKDAIIIAAMILAGAVLAVGL